MLKSHENVIVVVRCRPLSAKECSAQSTNIVRIHPSTAAIEIKNSKSVSTPSKQFTFDTVYDECASQLCMYNLSFRPIVSAVLEGFNGTIFAYGQTGAGKTYTMEGVSLDPEKRGIIPNAFEQIFDHITHSENVEYLVSASYLEIYQEEVRDLLHEDKRSCVLKEKPGTGVYVKDLTVSVCKDVSELGEVLNKGKKNRSVGATNMNLHSSRSHSIFMISIEHCVVGEAVQMRVGKLNLVDLAGSERLTKTGAIGKRQKESIKINLSLSALGNVISALVDGNSSHIPYRDSKLTRLLQDSLGGNSKTLMIANIGPSACNYDETLTTLRFANRAKNIKNVPIVNEDPKDALLKQYKEEIKRLKLELEQKLMVRKGKKQKQSEEPSEVLSEEDLFLQKEQQLKNETATIMNDKTILAEEKENLLCKIRIQQEELREQQEAKMKLREKIESLEGRLVIGGKNILEHTTEQQKQLELQQRELAEQKGREMEILRKLEEEEETTVGVMETFSNLSQEVEAKTKRLKKLFSKLQSQRRENAEEQEYISRERREQELLQDDLIKQLKFTNLVIDNFIPPEEKADVLRRATYDEDELVWKLTTNDLSTMFMARPSANDNNRRPVTQYAQTMWKLTSNARYKSENVARIGLDLPPKYVTDYTLPEVNPTFTDLMDSSAGEELTIYCKPLLSMQESMESPKHQSRIKVENTNQSNEDDIDVYPSPRGFVPRN